MRSVRLDDELEQRLAEAATVVGQPVSALIREAVQQKCDEVLGDRLDQRLAGFIGSVDGGKRRSSRRTGREFTRLLERRRRSGR
jgi:Ribbon-helix-helix protein, copG family